MLWPRSAIHVLCDALKHNESYAMDPMHVVVMEIHASLSPLVRLFCCFESVSCNVCVLYRACIASHHVGHKARGHNNIIIMIYM
jgi:hypothetical protein